MAQNNRVCQAGPQDIDVVTALFIKCLDDEENWNYRFPYRHEYREDHWELAKSYVEFMVDEKNKDFEGWIVEVKEPESIWKAVAISMWDVSYVNKRLHGPSYVMKRMAARDGRRDANPIRNAAFVNRAFQARQSSDGKFGVNQLYLRILGTHPDYRRRGFGCSSGE